MPSTLSRALHMQGPGTSSPEGGLRTPSRTLTPACSRRRPPIPAHLVLRRGARGAHGAEGSGPRAPHASSRPRPSERRSGQHAGSGRRRRRSQSRGNGTAAGTQRGQREPARATARHHSVPSGDAAVRTPGFAPSPLRDPCSGTFRSKFRFWGLLIRVPGFPNPSSRVPHRPVWGRAGPDSGPAREFLDPGSATGRPASPGLRRFGRRSPVSPEAATSSQLRPTQPCARPRPHPAAQCGAASSNPALARPAPNRLGS